MKLSELKENLNNISGFEGKVAYREFPEGISAQRRCAS